MGVPAEPAPGVPDAPPPGKGVPEGPSIRLSGRVSAPAEVTGPVRIDAFDGDQRDLSGPRPAVVAVGHLAGPGDFELSVPAGSGPLWLGAYMDIDGNGRPDPTDPVGWYSGNPLTGEGDQAGLDLVLAIEAPPDGAG